METFVLIQQVKEVVGDTIFRSIPVQKEDLDVALHSEYKEWKGISYIRSTPKLMSLDSLISDLRKQKYNKQVTTQLIPEIYIFRVIINQTNQIRHFI